MIQFLQPYFVITATGIREIKVRASLLDPYPKCCLIIPLNISTTVDCSLIKDKVVKELLRKSQARISNRISCQGNE